MFSIQEYFVNLHKSALFQGLYIAGHWLKYVSKLYPLLLLRYLKMHFFQDWVFSFNFGFQHLYVTELMK